jgi:hypothetical protein
MILSKLTRQTGLGIGVLLICAGTAFAQVESVLVKRAAQLRDAPGESSRSIAPLAVQTTVTRLGERQGPWIKVRMADGTQGWMHMFDITSAGSAQGGNAGTGALRSITSFFNKGSAQANAAALPTSTVGIRGLGAEDIANAQPNMAALAQLDAARVDASQARQFAGSVALTSRTVNPLPVPAAPAAAPGGPAGGSTQFQGGG